MYIEWYHKLIIIIIFENISACLKIKLFIKTF